MKLTKQWLTKHNACQGGMEWYQSQTDTDAVKVIKKLLHEDKIDWANWLLCRVLNKKQRVQYAIYAAKLVLHIYEGGYPDDNRPRKAIEAAEAYLKNPCKKTKDAATATANAAYSAAYSAGAATAAAAAAAAGAISAGADSATNATYSARAAYSAATTARAAYSARADYAAIINYGIHLIDEGGR